MPRGPPALEACRIHGSTRSQYPRFLALTLLGAGKVSDERSDRPPRRQQGGDQMSSTLTPGRADAFADHEGRWDRRHPRSPPPDSHRTIASTAPSRHLGEVWAHGRQRWREVRHLGHVVEAHQAEIAGYVAAVVVQGLMTPRARVVRGKDRSDSASGQEPDPPGTRPRGPVAGDRRRHLGDRPSRRSLAIPGRGGASNQSGGPATCHTVLWPASSRCWVASSAPANWSTVTVPDRPGVAFDGDHRQPGVKSSSAWADSSGTITTMPSTPGRADAPSRAATDSRSTQRRRR